jgi:hypothetical protein
MIPRLKLVLVIGVTEIMLQIKIVLSVLITALNVMIMRFVYHAHLLQIEILIHQIVLALVQTHITMMDQTNFAKIVIHFVKIAMDLVQINVLHVTYYYLE